MTAARLSGRFACLLVLFAAPVWSAPPAPGKRGALAPPLHSMSRDNLERLRNRLARGDGLAPSKPADTDSVRLVALRIEFPDLPMGASPPADELHDRFHYQTQFFYISQYFEAASCGRLHLAVDLPDRVTRAAHPQADYGDNTAYDSLMVELCSEAVADADSSVDFSRYDGVLLVHAGPGQESDIKGDSPTQIWSGFLDDRTFRETLSRPDSVVLGIVTRDAGFVVRNVVVLPEWEVQDLQRIDEPRLGSLGVYAHEVGQKLGMIPLFDASPSPIPDSQGLGNFDLMAYGLWVANGHIPPLPSAFNRLLMGWVDPIDARADGDVVLRDQEGGPPDSVVARVPISGREYFLVSYVLEDPDGPIVKTCSGQPRGPQRFFEFEDRNGNCRFDYADLDSNDVLSPGDEFDTYAGAEWDFFLTSLIGSELQTSGTGVGLLVLHVDEEVLQEVLSRNSTNVNGDARRKAVDVEEADGIQDLDRIADNPRAFGSAEDFFVRGHPFGPDTDPSTRSATGAPTGIGIALAALPDSTPQSPGRRARVRVRFGATSPSLAAPRPRARRELAGQWGSDLVGLPLGDGRTALVVPADSGQVLLADADLEEAPSPDGDRSTLRPWRTVPPEWRGRWIGAPAVGDVDGDAIPEVVLGADLDSLGTLVTRYFAWHRDGTEVRDLDGNSATNTGLFASFHGSGRAPLLVQLDASPGLEVVMPRQDASGVRIAVSPPPAGMRGEISGRENAQLLGGPIAVRASGACSAATGLVWAELDTTTNISELRFAVPRGDCDSLSAREPRRIPEAAGPVRLVSGDLDGNGTDEVVVAASNGVVCIVPGATSDVAPGTMGPIAARLDAASVSPLALADLDGDGTLEILLATDRDLHVLSLTGSEMRGWPDAFRSEPALQSEPDPGRGAGSPLAADMDGDGALEILLQLPGGALLVWDSRGQRRRELEAALPARTQATPLLADLDPARPGAELAALASFTASRRFLSGPDSLVVSPRTEIAIWSLPRCGRIAWGELGGGPAHAFRDSLQRTVHTLPNDASLPSFVVGPNPAGAILRARVHLTAPAQVRCRLFDLEGQMVRQESRAGVAGSIVEFSFDVRHLASGVYLAQVELSTGGRRTRPAAVAH